MKHMFKLHVCILVVTFSQVNELFGSQYVGDTTMVNTLMETSLDKEYVSEINVLIKKKIII